MQKRSADDLGALREALARAVPQANLDDHRRWAARIGTMANAIVGLAAVVFALMMAAMWTAIGFATRGAMAENREIVEVLHLVGASDAFIAREFQTHFRRLGFRGALIGGASAMAFFLGMAGLSSWGSNSAGGAEIAAMFGVFALEPAGYPALAGIGAAIALLTGFLSRAIVFRQPAWASMTLRLSVPPCNSRPLRHARYPVVLFNLLLLPDAGRADDRRLAGDAGRKTRRVCTGQSLADCFDRAFARDLRSAGRISRRRKYSARRRS